MEPQQILYPGFFLDMLQRKVMVEEKEVLLTARNLMSSQSWRRHPGTCVYLCADRSHDLWRNGYRGRNVQQCLLSDRQPAEEAGERSTAPSVSSYRIWCRVSVEIA